MRGKGHATKGQQSELTHGHLNAPGAFEEHYPLGYDGNLQWKINERIS